MNKQRGLALSTLLIWCVAIALAALVGMKVVPSVLEYQSISSAVKSIANDAKDQSTVADIRRAFAKYADINDFSSIGAEDLEISKDGGEVVVAFSYEKRIHLFANVSLLIDFSGSSK